MAGTIIIEVLWRACS